MTTASSDVNAPPSGVGMPRGLVVLLTLAAATIGLGGMKLISGLIAPIFLALMLTIVVHPIRTWLIAKGAPGWLAAVAGLTAVYGILISVTLAMVLSAAKFATLIPMYQDEFNNLVSGLESWLSSIGVGKDQIDSLIGSIDPSKVAGVAADVITGFFGVLSNLLFLVLLLLFMGMDAGGYPAKVSGIDTARAPIAKALMSFVTGTRQYLVVSTIFGAIVAVIDTVMLWVLNVPLPVTWGLLAFITNYIPNVGFIIGLIPPAGLALLEGGPSLMITVIILYCAVNFVIQSVLQPRFIGEAVGLATTISFLSVVFWTFILGPLGALLAVPLTLLAKALLIDADPNAAWISPLISGGPGAAPNETTGLGSGGEPDG